MIFGLMTSGYIADALGWEAIFYFVGVCGCIWFLLWVFLGYNTPADHPRVSKVRPMSNVDNLYDMDPMVSGRAQVHRVQCTSRQFEEAAFSTLQKDLYIKGLLGTANRSHWRYLWNLYIDRSRTDISQEHTPCGNTSGNPEEIFLGAVFRS